MSTSGRTDDAARAPSGDSMRARFENTDWSWTSLGDKANWDPALTNAVSICLNSHFPLVVLAGPGMIAIYNDANIPLLERKHPAAFGRPAQEIWPETWNQIGPMLQGVQQSGQAIRHDDLPLLVHRHDGDQHLYFTFSYSPVTSAEGKVVAVLVVSLETTARVLQERRLKLLNRLATAIAAARSVDQTFDHAARALLSAPEDLPLSALYMCENSGELRMAFLASDGLNVDAVLPATLPAPPADRLASCPIQRSMKSGQIELFTLQTPVSTSDGTLLWRAVALPISLPGALTTQGVFVVALGPHLAWDEGYRDFLTVVLGHLGTGLAANEAAHETSSFLSIVFDHAPSGIAIADANGVLIRANDAYAGLLGIHKDQLVGSPMQSVYADDNLHNSSSSLPRLLEQAATSFSRETRYVRSGDGMVWVSEQMSLVRDSRGLPKFIVITTTDISERVLAQKETLAAQHELRRLYDRLQTIREEERVAIAREVHDQLGQVLSAAKIDIDLLEEGLTRQADPPSREQMLAELNSAQSALDQALQLVKVIVSELRAARLQEHGLFGAVKWHARDFERRTRIRCRVLFADGAHEPDGEVAMTLFRIMQEALTNVLRHASATDVTVSFHLRGAAVRIRVRDNGVGIRRGAVWHPSSFGIRGMRERAALLGGRLLIGPLPTQGTLVSALVPLPGRDRASDSPSPLLS
jgi:PAS domain S-box-containing protein